MNPTQVVIPAQVTLCVIPAKAGTQGERTHWIPACAGMTMAGGGRS
jgi:hypothetical protein